MTSVVSTQLSERDLSSALDGFVGAVGADHVLTDEADLREFRDPFACYMPLWLRLWNDDDLGPAVDTLRRLMLDRTIDHVPQFLSTILLASVMTKRNTWHEGDGPIPDAVIDKMGRELGRWMMRFGLYGDEAVVDLRFKKVKQAFEQIPGAEV